MIKKILVVGLVIIVIGALLPSLWGMMMDTSDTVGNLTGEGAGGTFIAAMWPIVLIIVGIGIAAGLIFYAIRKFNITKGGG